MNQQQDIGCLGYTAMILFFPIMLPILALQVVSKVIKSVLNWSQS